MMRVLMVTPELPTPAYPGTMAATQRQIESLAELGVRTETFDLKGVPKLKYIFAVPSVRRIARDVDIVHAHFGYCGWLARLQFKKPIVISFMGDDLLGTPDARDRTTVPSRAVVAINRRLARLADAVIVKSREMAEVLAPLDAYVLPNGVDIGSFRPIPREQARAILQWNRPSRKILFPGDPDNPRKGYASARDVLAKVCALSGEKLELVPLCGVPPEQVPWYMNASDAMLLTSFREGSPNVVKEAMACNLSVVSVAVGDVGELLKDVEGYEVHPRDTLALAEALLRVLARSERPNGRAALVDRGLDLQSVAKQLVDIYESVLGSTRSCHAVAGSEG